MAVIDMKAVRAGHLTWRFTWASTLAAPVTFYVYRDGAPVLTTTRTEATIPVTAGESPLIEIFDGPADRPDQAFPSFATVNWYATPGAASYRVQRLDGSRWTTLATLDDDGRGYFEWRSRPLADGTTYRYRVVPVAAGGTEGIGGEVVLLMVRRPDVPTCRYAYDPATGQMTVR
ncbi:MAG TPA: hypothetical protein VGN72_19765 [Tepidisphaeraceae bacterium]|jgi:hypothetical protein|nr:hypothetical protein [Tepidisphaeraceae bacterium]